MPTTTTAALSTTSPNTNALEAQAKLGLLARDVLSEALFNASRVTQIASESPALLGALNAVTRDRVAHAATLAAVAHGITMAERHSAFTAAGGWAESEWIFADDIIPACIAAGIACGPDAAAGSIADASARALLDITVPHWKAAPTTA